MRLTGILASAQLSTPPQDDDDMPLIGTPIDMTGQEYLDVSLPAGYDLFRILAVGVKLDIGDRIIGIVSDDAGATWHMNVGSGDSYGGMIGAWNAATNAIVTNGPLSYMKLSGLVRNGNEDIPTARAASLDLYLDPGSAAKAACLWGEAIYTDGTGTRSSRANWHLLETPARQNMIRLMPYGNEDNPPTSDEVFSAGTLYLFGVPTA